MLIQRSGSFVVSPFYAPDGGGDAGGGGIAPIGADPAECAVPCAHPDFDY